MSKRNEKPVAPYTPPLPSNKSRGWNRKTEEAGRGIFVTPENRMLHCESGLEAKAYLALAADRRVKDVREQLPEVKYLGEDGEWHGHTVDMLARLHDGSRVAFLVRPRRKADGMRLEAIMRSLAAHVPRSFADRYVQLHEGKLTRDVVSNGRVMLSVRLGGPSSDDPQVERVAAVVTTRMRIGQVIEVGGRGTYRALVRLLIDGRVRQVGRGKLDVHAVVEPVAAVEGEVA